MIRKYLKERKERRDQSKYENGYMWAMYEYMRMRQKVEDIEVRMLSSTDPFDKGVSDALRKIQDIQRDEKLITDLLYKQEISDKYIKEMNEASELQEWLTDSRSH